MQPAGGMIEPPVPTEVLAKRHGFPMTPPLPESGVVSAAPMPPLQAPSPLMQAPKALPMKPLSAGTTELIPGAMDWIRQLVVDMIPTRNAAAAAPAPAPIGGAVPARRINGALPQPFVGPPEYPPRMGTPTAGAQGTRG